MNSRRYNFPLHLLALLVVCCTFPLIFMGGLVTSHHAGMSVPDWPNSYGYNMFLFPPRLWIGGILYEHTHRLAASFVGFLSILLTICAWMTENPRWIKWLATSVLAAVIFQGILGGLRVIWVDLDLAIVHACVAQAFFCMAALMACVTSKWWIKIENSREVLLAEFRDEYVAASGLKNGRILVRLAFFCVGVIYLQLIIGACMRHFNAGLAIPDFPASYGHILPPTNLKAINDYRVMKLNLAPVAIWQIWLHFSHRVGALIVTICLISLIAHVIYHNRRDRKLLWPAVILFFLLGLQITLGIFTVLWRKPADVASAHVAGGALLLMTTFVLAIRAGHLYSMPLVVPDRSAVSESASANPIPA
jgi:cytochrome c oxidase assembly protein subunit 15